MPELSVIQRTYDLILWFVPFLHRLPRDHRFRLGAREGTPRRHQEVTKDVVRGASSFPARHVET
jgi:hypothetical protein